MRDRGLSPVVMDRLIEARRWDIYRDPFADEAAFDAYLEDTGAGLMWLAVQALGGDAPAEGPARDAGWAAGLAAFLRAIPELERRGRVPLLDGRPQALTELARRGLARLARARAARGRVPREAGAALLAGWQTRAILMQAEREPARVARGLLGLSGFSAKAGLIWASATGRW